MLSNCPFCESEDVEVGSLDSSDAIYDSDGGFLHSRYTAECNSCGAESGFCDTKELAKEAWNKRIS